MPLSEEELDRLEAQIPELSRRAFREAFEQAMASGHPVTVLDGDEIVQITRDGERRVIGQIEPKQVRVFLSYTSGSPPKKGQAWKGRVQ
jgi:hypothetical protein